MHTADFALVVALEPVGGPAPLPGAGGSALTTLSQPSRVTPPGGLPPVRRQGRRPELARGTAPSHGLASSLSQQPESASIDSNRIDLFMGGERRRARLASGVVAVLACCSSSRPALTAAGLAGACPRKACPARRRGGTPEGPRVTREGGGESTPQLGTLADAYRETSSSLSDNPARECARSIDDAPEEGSDSGASPPYHR